MASEALKLGRPGSLVDTHGFVLDIQHVPAERTFRVEVTHLVSLEELRTCGVHFLPPMESMHAAHDIVRLVYAARMANGKVHLHSAAQYVEKAIRFARVNGATEVA